MIASKPYVYLDESSATKKVSVYVKCSSLSISGTQTVQNDTLIITCNIVAGSTVVGPKTTNLQTPSSYSKVRVETKVAGTLVGSTTVKINASHFAENPYRPHVYIHTPTATSEVYAVIDTGGGLALRATDTLYDQLNHKVTFYLDEVNATTGGWFDWSDNNNDASTCNTVEVNLRNQAKTITKGKGTTDQNDADASSDE